MATTHRSPESVADLCPDGTYLDTGVEKVSAPAAPAFLGKNPRLDQNFLDAALLRVLGLVSPGRQPGWDGASLGQPVEPSVDPSGLEPPFIYPEYIPDPSHPGHRLEGGRPLTASEKAAVLRIAGAELEKMRSSGQISEKELKLRMKLLEVTLNHKMGFSSTAEPSHDYYEKKDGAWVLKPGKVAKGLDDRVNNRSGHNLTGCRRAVQSLILYAEAQLAKEEGDKQAKDFDDYVAGKHFDNLMPSNMSGRFQYYTPNPDRKNLIPGDRVRMKNHKFAQPPDEDGYEGSNVIYLGKDDAGHQLFIHMDGGGVERYECCKKPSRSTASRHRGRIIGLSTNSQNGMSLRLGLIETFSL